MKQWHLGDFGLASFGLAATGGLKWCSCQIGISGLTWINFAPLGEYAEPLVEFLKENNSVIAHVLGIALGVYLGRYAGPLIQFLKEKKRALALVLGTVLKVYLGGYVSPLVDFRKEKQSELGLILSIMLGVYLCGYVAPLIESLKEKKRRRIAGKDGNSCLVLEGESSRRTESQARIWIMDSGAKGHATGDLQLFSGELIWAKQRNWIYGVSGRKLAILASGTVQFPDFKLEEVYYVKGLGRNLISLSKFQMKFGYSIAFGPFGTDAYIGEAGATGRRICELRIVKGLYELDSMPIALDRIPAVLGQPPQPNSAD